MGTPWAVNSVVRKFRCWRARHFRTSTSSVSPSKPQFHDLLCDSPSMFCSPFASLCFSWYVTRSRSVKPSCAVTKFTLAKGRRVSFWYRAELPGSRDASSPTVDGSARQKSRTLSRKLAVHYDRRDGKVPTL